MDSKGRPRLTGKKETTYVKALNTTKSTNGRTREDRIDVDQCPLVTPLCGRPSKGPGHEEVQRSVC